MNKTLFFEKYEHLFGINGLSQYDTPELCERFALLTDYMLKVNAEMNLTAITDEAGIIARHYIDCLFAASSFPAGATVLDVGSGGGMPALPLAIVRPDLTVTALDATAKKTAYILSAAKEIGLTNIRILTGRAEELGRMPEYRERFDVCTARAVARLRVLLEWCSPFIKPDGLMIAMKGKSADEERDEAKTAADKLSLRLVEECPIELLEEDETSVRKNLFYKKTGVLSSLYPRSNARIQKKPL